MANEQASEVKIRCAVELKQFKKSKDGLVK